MKSKKLWANAVLAMLALICCLFWGIPAKAASLPVTGVKQTDALYNAVLVKWNALTQNNVTYEIEVKKENEPVSSYKKAESSIYEDYAIVALNSSATVYDLRIRAGMAEDGQTTWGDYSAPIKVITSPATSPSSMKQTKGEEKSITLSWSAVSGATGYRIVYAKDGSKESKYVDVNGKTSYKITKLSTNTRYIFNIYAYKKQGSFVTFSNNSRGDIYTYGKGATIPTKISGIQFKNYDLNSKKQYFVYNKRTSADGIEYRILDTKGKKIVSGTVTPSKYSTSKDYISFITGKIKTNKYYKIQLRGFVYINGGKKAPGQWSAAVWFGQGSKVKDVKRSGRGVNISWEKMGNAKNYTVYLSTKQNTGYKKVGTTKKTNITINKFNKKALKNGQKYWVYVVVNGKVGGKTVKSLSTWTLPFTYYD